MSWALQVVSRPSPHHRKMNLGLSFMTRDKNEVMRALKQFALEKTNLALEYATVKPNRWDNYGWYANTDLPMIKRMRAKKGKK